MSWVLGLHLISAHWPGCYDFEGECRRYEVATPGIYARHEDGATFGAYRNSYGRPSAYAGWTFETKDKRFALTVAGVTGYPAAPLRLMVAPSVRFPIGGMSVRLAGAPKIGASAALLHLALEW